MVKATNRGREVGLDLVDEENLSLVVSVKSYRWNLADDFCLEARLDTQVQIYKRSSRGVIPYQG